MKHRIIKQLAIIGAAVVGFTPLTNSHTPAEAAQVRGCDDHSYRAGPTIEVCGFVRYAYLPGTCNPVKFDVKAAGVRVTRGASSLHFSALDDWTFEVTRGTGRNVVLARYDRTVLKDGDGTVDQVWRSVSFTRQAQGHLSMGGNVDVKSRFDWTASINVDIPRRPGCLA